MMWQITVTGFAGSPTVTRIVIGCEEMARDIERRAKAAGMTALLREVEMAPERSEAESFRVEAILEQLYGERGRHGKVERLH